MAQVNSTRFAERFWAKVNKTETCWLWTGSHSRVNLGYGQVQVPDATRRCGRRKLYAHRVSWELTHGPIPENAEVCHNCPGGDNPLCVNPDHLFLGTHADNMTDAASKGQMPRGERRPTAKLTDENVRFIRNRYAAGDITQQALADEFNVALSQINGIVNHKSWRHV